MPLRWVPPELFIRYKRVSVYRTYRHDTAEDPNTYHYVLDPTADEDAQFDVRDLDAWQQQKTIYLDKEEDPNDHLLQIARVLKLAIDNGELKPLGTHIALHSAIPPTEYNAGIPSNIDCLLGLYFTYYDPETDVLGDEIPVDGTDIEDWMDDGSDGKCCRYGTVITEHILLPSFGGPMQRSGVQYEIDMTGLKELLSYFPELDLPKLSSKVCGDEPAGYVALALNYRTWTSYDGEYDSEPELLGVFDFKNLKIIPIEDFL